MSQTISDQIRLGESLTLVDKSFRNQALIHIGSDYILLNTESVASKYRSQMMKYVAKYSLTGKDAIVFAYKPNYLSYKLYGTIEMAPFILEINHMISATEFYDLDKGIYLFNGGINTVLNEILNREERNLMLNREEIEKELASITE